MTALSLIRGARGPGACGNAAAAALALLMGAFGLGATPPAPPEASQAAGLLRLTEAQYRDTVADLFGEDIRIE